MRRCVIIDGADIGQYDRIQSYLRKDDTDTAFAVKEALSRGFQDFLLVGVIGGRLDHTLGNVSLLLMLDAQGKAAMALDDFSEMQIVSDQPAQIEDRYACFSLLNISGTAWMVLSINGKRFWKLWRTTQTLSG